jgi:hypothetical protein
MSIRAIHAPGDSPKMSSLDPNFAHSDLTAYDQNAGLVRYANDQAAPAFLKAHTPAGSNIDSHA